MDKIVKNPKGTLEKNEELFSRTGTLRVFGTGSSACRQNSFLKNRGQQVLEYAIVIAAISAALATMYVYTKRALQAHIKAFSDNEICYQNEIFPLASGAQHESGISNTSTISFDTSRVNKSYEEARYDFQSASTAEGDSNMTFNSMK